MKKAVTICAVVTGIAAAGVVFVIGHQTATPTMAQETSKEPATDDASTDSRSLDRLPDVFTKNTAKDGTTYSEVSVKAEEPKDLKAELALTNPRAVAFYVIGDSDINNTTTYYYEEHDIHPALTDRDGGTIRLIMQHEMSGTDELRMIDEHISTEFTSNIYGKRGRHAGLYGWTRQSGGVDHAWILGDGARNNLANPWDWAWVLDYKWRDGEQELPRGKIRFYTHPHVTTRVVILD